MALAGVIIAVGIWCALVLLYAPILPGGMRVPAAAVAGLVTLAALIERRHSRWRIARMALVILAVGVWFGWARLAPAADAPWIPELARTPTATIRGDEVTVRNVRNFEWKTETNFVPSWEERRYDLHRLQRVDLLLSYWAGENIAHTMLSFGFDDGRQLAASIEIRRQTGQEYSEIAGFFRNYALAYVLADERDVVRLRTNVRGERVYLYRLRAAPEAARALFLEYVREINDLARHPRFYNTLTTNCTTQIRVAAIAAGGDVPWDWRAILSGRLPEYLYRTGRVDTRLPLPELERRSLINGAAQRADHDPLFSQRIRDGRPDPRL